VRAVISLLLGAPAYFLPIFTQVFHRLLPGHPEAMRKWSLPQKAIFHTTGEVLCGVLVVSWLAQTLRVRTSADDSRREHLGSGGQGNLGPLLI
jgi:hypothetical protein